MPTTRRASYSAAGASDANTGADWGTNVKKTIDGLNAASAAGDTGLLPVTPEYDSGINATWPANGTAAVPVDTYASKVALITDCIATSGWLAAAGGDVVAGISYSTTCAKNGAAAKLKMIFDAAPQANTLQAYCPVANLSLAAFQDLECWVFVTTGTMPASSLVIKLCTGNDGATGVVATLTFPEAAAGTSYPFPVCIRSGSAFADGINSIGIYTGAVAPAAASAWGFDTFYATNCHLTTGIGLCKVVKKPFKTVWSAGTVYGANAIVQASWDHGGNVCWKTTAGGTSGGTEPLWKTALYPGETLVDGTVTWVSQGDDESRTLINIRSFNVAGLTFTIDASPSLTGTSNSRGFYGTQETTDLYVIDPIRTAMAATGGALVQAANTNAGIDGSPISIKGGASTVDDSIVGITVFDGRNGMGYAFSITAKGWQRYRGVSFCRYYQGISLTGIMSGLDLAGLSFCGCIVSGFYSPGGTQVSSFYGITVGYTSNADAPYNAAAQTRCVIQSILLVSCSYGGIRHNLSTSRHLPNNFIDYVRILNCGAGLWAYYGIDIFHRLVIKDNTAGAGGIALYYATTLLLDRAVITDAVEFPSTSSAANLPQTIHSLIYSWNHDNTPGNHVIFGYNGCYGQYVAATKIWTFYITDATRTTNVPVQIRIGQVLCDVASVAYTVSIPVTPSNAAIFGRLRILAQSLPGIQSDQTATSAGTGLQTLTLTFTPSATGLVDVFLEIYVSSGTTHTLTWDEDSLSCVRGALATRVFAGAFLNALPSTLAMPYADVYPANNQAVNTLLTWGPNGTGYGPGEVAAAAKFPVFSPVIINGGA